MSSEEEATAANVLSQMSQIQQISCETIEATVINVGHHCDVETTASQGKRANMSYPFHFQHLVSYSPYYLPYNSYDVSSESLVLDHLITSLLIFFYILITFLLDIVLLSQGEILFWSLMGVKGLTFC